MSQKQGTSPKVKRAGKSSRIVSNPKVLNRKGGGGTPQAQLITSPDRIAKITARVYNLGHDRLTSMGVLNSKLASHLAFWSGATNETPRYRLSAKETGYVREALEYALPQTQHALLTRDAYGRHAVRFAEADIRTGSGLPELASVS